MAVERRLTIPGLLNKIPEAGDFVVQAAEAAGLDERAVYYCQMAVDEWCTNVIEHGYGEENPRNHINIYCQSGDHAISITIMDDSPPFDPTNLPGEQPNKLVENLEPGGLGWFFIRKMMDEVHYEYYDGHNTLTMIKRSSVDYAQPAPADAPVISRAMPNGVWVIAPAGRLDATGSRGFESSLESQLAAAHANLVVDMSGVTYISSGGLKALVTAWRKAQKLGGNLALASLAPRVRKVFEISGFDMLFVIAESVEAAAAKLHVAPGKS
ncbi:MAG TPA: anti-sigma factor antagonist [Aggregatilineales bacterium]|nr:anti-sigma factor antagonist [Aggregatilineales bacterium]